jgi:hypothetical protein
MLRRREAAVELMAARARHGESSAALQAAQAQFDEVLAAAELPFPGLSVAARRSINLSLLAYAEVLGARLAGTALLRLATQAAARRDPPASGWSRTQCEQLMTQISVALQSLVGPASSAGEISRRLAELRQVVRYDSDEDAIPTALPARAMVAFPTCSPREPGESSGPCCPRARATPLRPAPGGPRPSRAPASPA